MLYIRIKSNTWELDDFFNSSIWELVDFAYENKKDYPFLSSIDYYGVTYFSHQQVQNRILPEIQNIERELSTSIDMQKLYGYLSKVSQHKFLQIIGD